MPERRVRESYVQQSEEIEPQITKLLELAEKSLKNLERKEANLTQKVCMFLYALRYLPLAMFHIPYRLRTKSLGDSWE